MAKDERKIKTDSTTNSDITSDDGNNAEPTNHDIETAPESSDESLLEKEVEEAEDELNGSENAKPGVSSKTTANKSNSLPWHLTENPPERLKPIYDRIALGEQNINGFKEKELQDIIEREKQTRQQSINQLKQHLEQNKISGNPEEERRFFSSQEYRDYVDSTKNKLNQFEYDKHILSNSPNEYLEKLKNEYLANKQNLEMQDKFNAFKKHSSAQSSSNESINPDYLRDELASDAYKSKKPFFDKRENYELLKQSDPKQAKSLYDNDTELKEYEKQRELQELEQGHEYLQKKGKELNERMNTENKPSKEEVDAFNEEVKNISSHEDVVLSKYPDIKKQRDLQKLSSDKQNLSDMVKELNEQSSQGEELSKDQIEAFNKYKDEVNQREKTIF